MFSDSTDDQQQKLDRSLHGMNDEGPVDTFSLHDDDKKGVQRKSTTVTFNELVERIDIEDDDITRDSENDDVARL